MRIPKICNWYKIIPITYKIGRAYTFEDPMSIEFYCGFESPVVYVVEYQLQKKFLFWWKYVKHKETNVIVSFKAQEDAVNYVIKHNKGRSVNLIRE